MSAFLGPIHYWLYNKIQFQDNLVKSLASKLGCEEVINVNTQIGALPGGDLQDIIDEGNIHGWLQDKIHLVESRLSFVVESLCSKGVSMEQIGEVAYEVGAKSTVLTPDTSAAEAYKFLNDTLIDGMPCDHINTLQVQEVDLVEWCRSRNIHEEYWNEESRALNRFDLIRDQLIQGLLSTTELTYVNDNNRLFKIIGRD